MLPKLIEFPAAISKAELKAIVPLYGAANLTDVVFGPPSNAWSPGGLRFLTFAGALDLDRGLYVGVLRFEPVGDGPIEKLVPFEPILALRDGHRVAVGSAAIPAVVAHSLETPADSESF